MPLIIFTTHDGNAYDAIAESGTTLMQAAVDNGIDEIVAECGGACSCATCHCYIDEQWLDKVDPVSDIEKSMLECVLSPQDNSRLSCQITLTEEHNGMQVSLPERQF